jgi:RimJ/RimL family protein N-acetyltransferase
VATDNLASIRVLEKAGFSRVGTSHAFAAARGTDIDEHRYELGFFPAPTFIGSVIS